MRCTYCHCTFKYPMIPNFKYIFTVELDVSWGISRRLRTCIELKKDDDEATGRYVVRISCFQNEFNQNSNLYTTSQNGCQKADDNLLKQRIGTNKDCFQIQRYLPEPLNLLNKNELKSVISYTGSLEKGCYSLMEKSNEQVRDVPKVPEVEGKINPVFSDSDEETPQESTKEQVTDLDAEHEKESNNSHTHVEINNGCPPTAQISPTLREKHEESEHVVISITDENGNGEAVRYNQESSDKTLSNDQTKVKDNVNSSDAIDSWASLYFDTRYFKSRNEEMKWLTWIESKFTEIAGEDGEISLDEFKDALGVKRSFFAERFFSLFDQDQSGTIECSELMDGIRMLTRGTPAQKLKFLFDVYDVDGSGSIDHDELKTVLRSCMEESSLSLGEENLTNLTNILFEAADEDKSGTITFEELKAELEKHPGVLENLTISAAQWLKPPTKKKKKKGCLRYLSWSYIRNNFRKVIFNIFFLLINLALAAYTIWKYRESNGFVIVARIGGMNLNFTCSMILVLMLRKCLTYLRNTKLGNFLPLDQNILFHKMVGIVIAVYGVIHTLAHIGNALFIEFAEPEKNLTTVEILFTQKAGIGWVANTAYLTGWPLLLILIVIVICSLPFVRRGGYFQVFYWTHMLYVPFWILLILHGPIFWMFFVAPGVIFVLEKISRSKLIKRARYGTTHITEVNLLPSGVCHLCISRPENFKYEPGDYIFIQIPVIAKYEWHPFTISSAPEMQGHIWLHVRSLGHWTNKLHEYFSNLDPIYLGKAPIQLQKRRSTLSPVLIDYKGKRGSRKKSYYLPKDKQQLEVERRIAQKHKQVRIKCYIDGPYGTATREIFETEHAVLIGAGIGITPMASILQSVLYRYKESKRTCPVCQHSFYGVIPESAMKLKKVDFMWINRDQKAFEWFVSLLTHIEKEQIDVAYEEGKEPEKVIEMHMYMTAAQGKTDMKGIGLQIALDLLHKKDNKDLITGLKTRTQAGRPNWNQVFTKISNAKKGKVKVFFCGSPALGKTIKEACMKFKFKFSKENF